METTLQIDKSQELIKTITSVCSLYGYSEPKDKYTFKELLKFVNRRFSRLSSIQILEAFELSSLGKLSKQIDPVGEQINASIIGSVLSAYNRYQAEKARINPPKIKYKQLSSGEQAEAIRSTCKRLIELGQQPNFDSAWTYMYQFVNKHFYRFTLIEKEQSIEDVTPLAQAKEAKPVSFKDQFSHYKGQDKVKNLAMKKLVWEWAVKNKMTFDEMVQIAINNQ